MGWAFLSHSTPVSRLLRSKVRLTSHTGPPSTHVLEWLVGSAWWGQGSGALKAPGSDSKQSLSQTDKACHAAGAPPQSAGSTRLFFCGWAHASSL